MTNVQAAFLLTLLAGSLGFSAGVMIHISLVELLPLAQRQILAGLGHAAGWAAVGCFFGGILLTGVIDALVLRPFLTDTVMGMVIALVAVYSLVGGMAVSLAALN